MTQWSFYAGRASISSEIPKSSESTARHVCNTSDEPLSSPQKNAYFPKGRGESLLLELTKQQITCQQLRDHSIQMSENN